MTSENSRIRSNRRALKRLGPERFAAFVRAARADGGCEAITFVVDDLDEGKTAEELLITDLESGYELNVEILGPMKYRVSFACSPGPMLGDGGEWDVTFDVDGRVIGCEAGPQWIS